MNITREQRLRDERRAARMGALSKAQRARRRELALVEEYLALIRFNSAQPPRAHQALAPGEKR